MDLVYSEAPDVKKSLQEIVAYLSMSHIDLARVYCRRSRGSAARRTVARIHGLGKIWQSALELGPCYVIEVISEKYDVLSLEDKEKTLIHELLHIPKSFAGGFRPHKGHVTRRSVEKLYRALTMERKAKIARWHRF